MAKYQLSKEEKKNLNSIFWRSGFIFGSFNMVKMMGQGFEFTMNRVLDRLYANDEEAKKEALKRHVEFFNTHACMVGFIAGLTYAMEKEKLEKGNVDADAITNVKIALMGPLAGIGDSLFFSTIRIIAAGIGISLAATGSILGALIFILIYGGSFLLLKWYLVRLGYSTGTNFIDTLYESGMMRMVTKAASTLGLIMVGAMVAQMVNINIAFTADIGGASIVAQEILDGIMPGILSLLLVFGLYRLIKKGIKPTLLVIGLIICCILLAAIGVF